MNTRSATSKNIHIMISSPFIVFNDVAHLKKDALAECALYHQYVTSIRIVLRVIVFHYLPLEQLVTSTKLIRKFFLEPNFFPVLHFHDEANDIISTVRDQTHVL